MKQDIKELDCFQSPLTCDRICTRMTEHKSLVTHALNNVYNS